ncbi:7181_t:CDS:2 [Funneliformis geosporum]|uniref:833_t:CDS:1 n=1 Tax=Funneliformis geosporum TaxID=1117311 RepID=A0A9W4T0G2_9GLOM|nr:7181_t:CDS:2 [Funneliformis geosporum]CAI2187267.1 833_t:CDS:2 [Funneliformis geosporum]
MTLLLNELFQKDKKHNNEDPQLTERNSKIPRIDDSSDDKSSRSLPLSSSNCMSEEPLEIKDVLERDFVKDIFNVSQVFEDFAPLIKTFLSIGKEIMEIYELAEHHKELCGFLLQRCNCAMAAVQDLKIRKTENLKFFSKKENKILFEGFINCIRDIKNFIKKISHLSKFKRLFYANNIEENFTDLLTKFDGYMKSLNFSFTIQTRVEVSTIRCDLSQIKEILLRVYGLPDDKSFLNRMELVSEKNKEFQEQSKLPQSLHSIEVNETLLDGSHYQQTNVCPSKRIHKRSSIHENIDYTFSEIDKISSFDHSQIRRQVNILKELKDSEYIIKFFGLAEENSKYYLVTEWMEYGNLSEYYTRFKENMNWKFKTELALDICRGVAYLHECKILHRDIRSTNILINKDHKAKIANFGLSRNFSELTSGNQSHFVDTVRYFAPEKLFDNDKKVPYDSKSLLWEIAELKKPHSDLDTSKLIEGILNRVCKGYHEPFSNSVPDEWKNLVSRAMEYKSVWRPNITDICENLYDLKHSDLKTTFSNEYIRGSTSNVNLLVNNELNNEQTEKVSSFVIIKILSMDDAIREHCSKNGNKQVVWDSFKYHSMVNIEARYWVGYYYYYHGEDIPELQNISKDERIKIAIDIFKETADKGNLLAREEYGKYLLRNI